MDDSMRMEYPGMLANLQPMQAVQALNDRVKRISKLNTEIADWLQERRKVEETYAQGLRKLAQFRVPNAQSELGTFQPQWDRVIASTEAVAHSHHMFAAKIEKDVEIPLRTFHARKEFQNVQTVQGNLQSMGKELEDAQKKVDALHKKGGKASVAKMDQATTRLDSATNQWDSQAPFILETLQALDETRMNHLRDVLTQYGTYEGEQAQQIQADAESVLNSLLDYQSANEIRLFANKTTAGRPRIHDRGRSSHRQSQSSSVVGTGPSTGASLQPTQSLPPPPPIPDDTRSDAASLRDDGKLRSRLGTMLGRRRQSIHAGFGPLSPALRGPFGRNVKSSHGLSPRASSSNLGERQDSQNRLSALPERPDTADGITSLGGGRMSPDKSKASYEDPNGINGTNGTNSANGANGTHGAHGVGSDSTMDDFRPHTNGSGPSSSTAAATPTFTDGAYPQLQQQEQPQETEKDGEGFSVPATSLDPISAAEKEAAEENEQAFKLSIQEEPVAEEDPEERQAALSKFSSSMSAMGVPARRTPTIRGRRDVRNTIFMPSTSELPPFPPSPNLPASSTLPSLSKSSTMAAFTSENSIAGTSDAGSIRSGHSLGSVIQFQHPDMHEPGLNSSVIETVSAHFESGGEIKSVKINGEIAFSYNPASPIDNTKTQSHQPIRINNFAALEVIGPNRIFVANHGVPDHPDQFTLDLTHLRPAQPIVGFSYRLHVDEAALPIAHVPLLLNPVWKPQGDKLGLLVQYKLNPAFKFASTEISTVTFHNIVLFAHYEGKASGVQTKPSGTHLKDKHLVYWRLGDLTLNPGADWQKLVCRVISEGGAELRPGTVEARWEFACSGAVKDQEGISVACLESEGGAGKREAVTELSDDDPFADADAPGSEGLSTSGMGSGEENRWVEVPCVRRLVSGKFEAS